MNIRFYVDPETGIPHVYRHSVNEDEVADVLANPGEDRLGREGARIAIGKLRGKPLTAYRRRLRRRGKR